MCCESLEKCCDPKTCTICDHKPKVEQFECLELTEELVARALLITNIGGYISMMMPPSGGEDKQAESLEEIYLAVTADARTLIKAINNTIDQEKNNG